MLRSISKILSIIFLSILLLVSFSCDAGGSDDMKAPPPPPNGSTKAPATNDSNPTDSANKTKIKSADGTTFAEISQSGSIEFSGKKLIKRQKNAEKSIYAVNGNEIAEVKTKDAEGFKVRDMNSKLLWKIKIKDDKIKISDNEENENPFEIKKRDNGSKVVLGDKEFGKVKFNSDSKKIKVKDASGKELFEAVVEKSSMAYGVLLLEEIPEEQRFIIFSELLSRNL